MHLEEGTEGGHHGSSWHAERSKHHSVQPAFFTVALLLRGDGDAPAGGWQALQDLIRDGQVLLVQYDG